MHRQSNQFQMTSYKYITDASNLIGKAKFVVAVVGPVTLLSTDAALESRVPHQSPGSGNTNVTIAVTNLCHSLTLHHACTPVDMLFPPVIGGLIVVMVFLIGIY